MMQKAMKCGFIGGLILFVWGMISWMVFPWHMNQFKQFSNEREVRSTIQRYTPETGLYMVPSWNYQSRDDRMAAKEQRAEGPVIFAAVVKEGESSNMTRPIIEGIILKVVAACIVAWLVLQTRLEFKKTVFTITLIGALLGMMGSIPYAIWFGFPSKFAFCWIFESIVGWFIAGLAMTKIAMSKK